MNTSNNFFAAVLLILSANMYAQGIQFQTSTYESMVADAQTKQKPFFIVFGFDECNICKNMETHTYPDENLGNYVANHITPYKVDALSTDGIGITQLFDIRQFPTILFFDQNGEKMGTIRGFYDPSNLQAQITKVVDKWEAKNVNLVSTARILQPISMVQPTYSSEEITEKRAMITRNAEVVESTSSEMIEESAESAAGEMLEESEMIFEELNSTIFSFSDVPGLQKYSVKDKKPKGFALKVGQFNTLEALKSELKEYEKRWKSEIWTYSQAKSGAKIYCLVLGQYEDKEQAIYMRKLLYNTFFIQSTVVKLDDIRYDK